MSQENVLPRSEIALEHTWNATSIYPSTEAWEQERQAILDLVPTLQHFQGHLGESPARLVEWFEASETLTRRLMQLYAYASMSYEVETTNQAARVMEDQVMGLFGRLAATAAFAEPELLAIGEETLRRWVSDEPRLKLYEHYVDVLLRLHAHIRSAEVEELLGMVTDPFATASSTSRILTNADMTFRPATNESGASVPVVQGNLDFLVASPDRELRRTAWESYADSHLTFKNTLANGLTAAVKQDVLMARARRYDSA
ncbi:MAG: oligoendopeptidase F, partial [Ardenticatenales bacterium]|nr:oligoendopeptidase F [Ardenticatenales bacterium]